MKVDPLEFAGNFTPEVEDDSPDYKEQVMTVLNGAVDEVNNAVTKVDNAVETVQNAVKEIDTKTDFSLTKTEDKTKDLVTKISLNNKAKGEISSVAIPLPKELHNATYDLKGQGILLEQYQGKVLSTMQINLAPLLEYLQNKLIEGDGITLTPVETEIMTMPNYKISTKLKNLKINDVEHELAGTGTIEINTKAGVKLKISRDTEDDTKTKYIYNFQLIDKNETVLSEQSIDLPCEEFIVSLNYDSEKKSLVFNLKNGETTTVPIGDIIEGLATKTYVDTQNNVLQNQITVNKTNITTNANEITTLKRDKQNQGDNTLTTTAKTIVGAINEIDKDLNEINSNFSPLSFIFNISNEEELTKGINLTLTDSQIKRLDSNSGVNTQIGVSIISTTLKDWKATSIALSLTKNVNTSADEQKLIYNSMVWGDGTNTATVYTITADIKAKTATLVVKETAKTPTLTFTKITEIDDDGLITLVQNLTDEQIALIDNADSVHVIVDALYEEGTDTINWEFDTVVVNKSITAETGISFFGTSDYALQMYQYETALNVQKDKKQAGLVLVPKEMTTTYLAIQEAKEEVGTEVTTLKEKVSSQATKSNLLLSESEIAEKITNAEDLKPDFALNTSYFLPEAGGDLNFPLGKFKIPQNTYFCVFTKCAKTNQTDGNGGIEYAFTNSADENVDTNWFRSWTGETSSLGVKVIESEYARYFHYYYDGENHSSWSNNLSTIQVPKDYFFHIVAGKKNMNQRINGAGYPGWVSVKLFLKQAVRFYISSTTYYAVSGMTWEQAIKENLLCAMMMSNGRIMLENQTTYLYYSGAYVKATDKIVAGATYELKA